MRKRNDNWVRDYRADIEPIQQRYPALMKYLHFGLDDEVKREIIKLVAYTDQLEMNGVAQLRTMFPELPKAPKKR
jgi:hypothetical protein